MLLIFINWNDICSNTLSTHSKVRMAVVHQFLPIWVISFFKCNLSADKKLGNQGVNTSGSNMIWSSSPDFFFKVFKKFNMSCRISWQWYPICLFKWLVCFPLSLDRRNLQYLHIAFSIPSTSSIFTYCHTLALFLDVRVDWSATSWLSTTTSDADGGLSIT
jgi:hypothetical protein